MSKLTAVQYLFSFRYLEAGILARERDHMVRLSAMVMVVDGYAAQKLALPIFPHDMLIDCRQCLDSQRDQTSTVFCILPRNEGASV